MPGTNYSLGVEQRDLIQLQPVLPYFDHCCNAHDAHAVSWRRPCLSSLTWSRCLRTDIYGGDFLTDAERRRQVAPVAWEG